MDGFLGTEESLTRAALFITLVAAVLLAVDVVAILSARLVEGAVGPILEQVVFILIVFGLIFGNIAYQLSRLGHVRRLREAPAPDGPPEPYEGPAPSLAVLVPSYKEEPAVVAQTLLSAALMDYPFKRVVLLLDDPPAPRSAADAEGLAAMRELPGQLAALFAAPRARIEASRAGFEARRHALDLDAEMTRAVDLLQASADWLDSLARFSASGSHTDRFFADAIIGEIRRVLRADAARLAEPPGDPVEARSALDRAYRRLHGLFSAEFQVFERKRFANLSHEANKAMNLNAYIGLMGKRVRETLGDDGLSRIEPCDRGEEVPDADYVITLDADSLLFPDYALRLVRFAEAPENADVAIVQTPYSAYPGAPGAIERIAGATTDIQHIVHQGFTRYNGTYWVGANAVIRRRALDDIAQTVEEDGITVTRYILDRTVIEDTESTVDLMAAGWRLHNYPARLAYSATPPDFGSLIIQRRRWSNGGLIILPKLLRLLARAQRSPASLLQATVQTHYLLSPALTSTGVLVIILYPFEESIRSLWLPLTALPYFYLYGRDLARTGYGWSALPQVYALNLMLLPVQLGGVLKSIQQLVTGRKTPFGRTPKVGTRTAAPPLYVGSVMLLVAYCFIGSMVDIAYERWAHAAFAAFNGVLFGYALVTYIGLRFALEDVTCRWRARRSEHAPATLAPVPGSATLELPSPIETPLDEPPLVRQGSG